MVAIKSSHESNENHLLKRTRALGHYQLSYHNDTKKEYEFVKMNDEIKPYILKSDILLSIYIFTAY